MGKSVDIRRFLSDGARGRLAVYINPPQCVQTASVSIGKMLAAAILQREPQRRSKELARIFEDVLSGLPDDTTVRYIDVLFNPAHKVDVLRVLETARRKKSYAVIWPGEYEDGKLVYGEYGYDDYKEYSVSEYDIYLCVR